MFFMKSWAVFLALSPIQHTKSVQGFTKVKFFLKIFINRDNLTVFRYFSNRTIVIAFPLLRKNHNVHGRNPKISDTGTIIRHLGIVFKYYFIKGGIFVNNIGLGARLRELRNSHSLTQKQVAERLGIAISTLSGYEIEEKNPSYYTLLQFSRLYGVSTDFLLGATERRSIDVSDLDEDEIAIVTQLVTHFRHDKPRNC